MKLILAFSLVLLSSIASAQIRYTSTDGTGRKTHRVSRSELNKIAVLMEKSEVPKEAKRIGIISALFDDEATALFQAKKMAAQVGGDAILIVKTMEDTGIERRHKHKQRYGYWVYEYLEVNAIN
jgi:hypothetical protein